MGYMKDHIGEPAMYEQMAEECTELAKAALKMARIIRNENPTPVTESEAYKNIIEEYTDVQTCARELGIESDPEIERRKEVRFYERYKRMKGE